MYRDIFPPEKATPKPTSKYCGKHEQNIERGSTQMQRIFAD